jgi:hypothetical protein
VNKLAENGTFASTETKYCRVTKMRPTDLVLDAIERAQQGGGRLNNSNSAQLARVSAHEGLGKQW